MNPTNAGKTTSWRKATASDGGTNCVEVRRHEDHIEVRHSKDPDGAVLRFTASEFRAWEDGSAKGEFNDLTDNLP